MGKSALALVHNPAGQSCRNGLAELGRFLAGQKPDPPQRFLDKRSTVEQWIKEGKQAVKMTRGGLPPVPVERGAAMVERDRIQLGQPAAAADAAEGNRQMVVDQLAAVASEDRRAAGKACP